MHDLKKGVSPKLQSRRKPVSGQLQVEGAGGFQGYQSSSTGTGMEGSCVGKGTDTGEAGGLSISG